jgi:hypothetical protein
MAIANRLMALFEEVGEDRIAQLELLLGEMKEHEAEEERTVHKSKHRGEAANAVCRASPTCFRQWVTGWCPRKSP